MRNKQKCNVNHSLTYCMFKLLVEEAAEQASQDQREQQTKSKSSPIEGNDISLGHVDTR